MPRKKRMDTPVLDALNESVAKATHLNATVDAAAIEAARALARKIDLADEYFERLAAYHAENDLRPPSADNVSIPTFLKYCESLGLTPAGRTKLTEGKKPEGKPGGKLASVSNVPRPQTA